jgi:hypothetical protein
MRLAHPLMGEPEMKTKSLRAVTALLLTAVTLAISACAVYETGPRHNGWGFHDRGDRGWHDGRGWR